MMTTTSSPWRSSLGTLPAGSERTRALGLRTEHALGPVGQGFLDRAGVVAARQGDARLLGQRAQRIAADDPPAVARDADRHDLMTAPLEGGDDGGGRGQGDLVLAGASAEDHAHAQARHDPYSSSPLRRARYPIGGVRRSAGDAATSKPHGRATAMWLHGETRDQRPSRGDAAGIGASDWMKPLAIRRRSSRGAPNTVMRSPRRSARHVASFSCERSTDRLRPSEPRSATVDPLTGLDDALDPPHVLARSAPIRPPRRPTARRRHGGHQTQRGCVTGADGDGRDLVGTAALDAEHGDARCRPRSGRGVRRWAEAMSA